jgi:hypothetical protein
MNPGLEAIPKDLLAPFGRRALIVGAGAALVSAGAAFTIPEPFFRAYLVGYLFWLGISLGCLALLMIQHLYFGSWAVVIRRLLEAGARTLPLMAVLFLPLLAGIPHLYEWSHPEAVQHDPILQDKAAYLNVPFFLWRAAGYFAIWLLLAYLLPRWSRQQDQRRGDDVVGRRMRVASGPGIAIFVLTATFASVDWVMSLEPHWYSTIYGALFMAGQALAAMSFAIAAVVLLRTREPLASAVSPAHLHDLGKLLLTFVMVWAYFAFSQFLIVWSGNLPEEIPWYLRRLRGGWQWIGLLIVVGQFFLPFVLLLSRSIKRDSRILVRVALLVVALRLVDSAWLVVPAFEHGVASVLLLTLVTAAAVGGLWLATFTFALSRQPLLPLGDPHLSEALAHGRH